MARGAPDAARRAGPGPAAAVLPAALPRADGGVLRAHETHHGRPDPGPGRHDEGPDGRGLRLAGDPECIGDRERAFIIENIKFLARANDR